MGVGEQRPIHNHTSQHLAGLVPRLSLCIGTRLRESINMASTVTIVLYAGGALFLLLFALWLAVTVYIYLLHRRYAHIPSPKMPR